MARSCRFRMSALRSLTEGNQTCSGHAKIDANDPLRSAKLASKGRPLDSTKSSLRQNRKPRSGALRTARPAEKAAANIGMDDLVR
jgi:hypothetical protein